MKYLDTILLVTLLLDAKRLLTMQNGLSVIQFSANLRLQPECKRIRLNARTVHLETRWFAKAR